MKRFSRAGFLLLLLLIVALQLAGCAGAYFREAENGGVPVQYGLAGLPYSEYWAGIVFNGDKIGFSHFTLRPADDEAQEFNLEAEAFFAFRFFLLDKKVNLRSEDRLGPDLTLRNFSYAYQYDDNHLQLKGTVSNNRLEADILAGGEQTHKTYEFDGALYPASIINLYPVYHGLEVGRQYHYEVFDGETQSIETVDQEVVAFEESKLFAGKAFKVRTIFHGQEVFSWINRDGEAVLELSLGGVLISYQEDEVAARKYLTEAALNKSENLLDFSLIRTARAIPEPRQTTFLEVRLTGFGGGYPVPTDTLQQCAEEEGGTHCRIKSYYGEADPVAAEDLVAIAERYLASNHIIPAKSREISDTAGQIAGDAASPLLQIHLLVDWLYENIDQVPEDVFSALDVLHTRKAECQGLAFLYAAFARSLGIPTRVVNGIVYAADEHQGFFYHTWAESYVEGCWLPVDPTFGQVVVDATHIKLVEGEGLDRLAPLMHYIGRLQVEILAVE